MKKLLNKKETKNKMKYKLTEPKDEKTIQEEILSRRGIENPQAYLNTTDKDILFCSLFGDVMTEAYNVLKEVISSGGGIAILVDSDFDGMSSASMLYSYLNKTFGISPKYYLHENKERGVSDLKVLEMIKEDIKTNNLKLLFIPDAGSNDSKECEILSDLGLKIIITDHHQIEKENKFAILINPQLIPDYKNLSSSGCLITWKFLKFIDDQEWTSNSDYYFDLVGTSIIADGMDITSLENRRLIELGLSNIKNKFLDAVVSGDYRIKETPTTITEISFYLTPTLNGLIRVGTQDEKDLVFRALCEIDEEFDYVKRDKTVIKESIYQRAFRISGNAKSKQDRRIEKAMDAVIEDIEKFNRNNNKILFALADESLDKSFTGLVAMKLASKYNKPCVLLREYDNVFAGSGRNFNGSPLTDLKSFIKSFGYLNWAQGHSNSFGCSMTRSQLFKTIELSNAKLEGYDFSKFHNVDFEFDNPNDIEQNLLQDLYSMRFYYGNGIEESKIFVKNIEINTSQLKTFGYRESSEKTNWKQDINDFLCVLKFNKKGDEDFVLEKVSSGDFSWSGETIRINAICKIGYSEFMEDRKYSLIIDEYEVIADE